MQRASSVDKFSPSEQRLLSLLTRRETDTEELAKRYWSGREKPPHARQVILNLTRALIKKTARGNEKKVRKSARTGPKPIKVWVE